MKKKLFLWMAALTFGFAIVSCSDNDANSTDPVTPDTPVTPVTPDTPDTTSTADYTVIFWGMSGKCDPEDCVDLARLANKYQKGLVGKNVNIVGLMKTSVSLMFSGLPETVDKTWYFDSEKIDSTKTIPESELTFSGQATGEEVKKTYEDAFAVMNGREYADLDYPLNNVDSLASFIKRAAEKFPARHYVLLTFGHGGGFSPVDDTPLATKVSVPDYFRDYVALTADQVVSAVQKSEVKIQTYFTHSCLMASLENMAAFSQVFDYAVLSAELTYGHYLPEYMEKLTEAGSDETKMQEKSRELIDYYAKLYSGGNDAENTSHGFYDLKQMPTLLSIVKEAADWYAENYTGAEGDSIEKAMMNSVCCVNLFEDGDETKTMLMRNARVVLWKLLKGDAEGISTDEQIMSVIGVAYGLMGQTPNLAYGFVMSDVMRNTLTANISQDKIAKLKDIYDRYMTTLKGMAYIGASNKPAKADDDYAYIYTSPTINIFSLNPDYFIPIPQQDRATELLKEMMEALKNDDMVTFNKDGHELLDGTPFANWAKLDVVKYNYTSSVFDQKVGWSKFLEKAKFNLSVVTNTDRWAVNENMK